MGFYCASTNYNILYFVDSHGLKIFHIVLKVRFIKFW